MNFKEISSRSGIFTDYLNSSEINRCLVTGEQIGRGIGGIAHRITDTSVKYCAIGKIHAGYHLVDALSYYNEGRNSISNNVAIDSTKIQHNVFKTESIAAARFKQRLFETTLGWDFDNIWVWDDKNDRPALRYAGADNLPPSADRLSADQTAEDAQTSTDLLTHQVTANIWL